VRTRPEFRFQDLVIALLTDYPTDEASLVRTGDEAVIGIRPQRPLGGRVQYVEHNAGNPYVRGGRGDGRHDQISSGYVGEELAGGEHQNPWMILTTVFVITMITISIQNQM
jgi:hypothetical protein